MMVRLGVRGTLLILPSTSGYLYEKGHQLGSFAFCRRRLIALRGLCVDWKATAFPFELHTWPLHDLG